jgi:para-nitrobenzyl esterase
MYLFAWQTPVLDGRLYAPHGLDIPFAFDNLEQLPNMTAGALGASELAAKVSEAWISFARDGEPGHAGLPEWPAYTLGRRATMIFDRKCHAENDPDAAVRKLWATL